MNGENRKAANSGGFPAGETTALKRTRLIYIVIQVHPRGSSILGAEKCGLTRYAF
jgi:hypothetical protein